MENDKNTQVDTAAIDPVNASILDQFENPKAGASWADTLANIDKMILGDLA